MMHDSPILWFLLLGAFLAGTAAGFALGVYCHISALLELTWEEMYARWCEWREYR